MTTKKGITELTLEEFKKLNLYAFRRVKKSVDENSIRLAWEKVFLNDLIEKELNACSMTDEKVNNIVIAIHKRQDDALKYEEIWEKDYKNACFLKRGAKKPEELPDNFYYYDKWLNHFGATTYLFASGVSKLYQKRKKYYITEDYFDIQKSETEKIYFIKIA